MNLKLKHNEKCPIHGSYFCCGRASRAERFATKKKHRPMKRPGQKKGWTKIRPGLSRIEDLTNPRGYRERRNKTAMRDLLIEKIREQKCICALCHEPMEDMENIAPDHIDPKGAGGQWHDDHPSNIQAVHHFPCNLDKGSRRL